MDPSAASGTRAAASVAPGPTPDIRSALKKELYDYLLSSLERAAYELYTLCEYDSNDVRSAEASDFLSAAARDFADVRIRAARPPPTPSTRDATRPLSPPVFPTAEPLAASSAAASTCCCTARAMVLVACAFRSRGTHARRRLCSTRAPRRLPRRT